MSTRFIGPADMEPHVLGDLERILGLIGDHLGREVPAPKSVALGFLPCSRTTRYRGRDYYVYQWPGGDEGVSYAYADRIWLVRGPREQLNPHWRKCIEHECWHVALFAAGVPAEKQHAILDRYHVGQLYAAVTSPITREGSPC